MKVFFSTLCAILAAAVIMWQVFSAYQTRQADLKLKEEIRQTVLDTELCKAQSKWREQLEKNPRFDPLGEKLGARLREIREASENNRPIPPNPWQTPETRTTNNAQSQQPPIPEIQSPAAEYVTLNRDVEVSHGVNKIVIPKGSKLPVVSRGSRTVGVRFEGEQEIIPQSPTNESK